MKSSLETRLGLFFALVFVAAFVLFEMVGGGRFFTNGIPIRARFNTAGDLKVGDPVKLAGVDIGRVQAIRIADGKVRNRPEGMKGFFILEESYYLSEGKPLDRKPYLFLFEPEGSDKVRLTAYQLPGHLKKEDVRNDNDTLSFDYGTLQQSPTFKGAVYDWNPGEKSFSTRAPNELPGGMRFTLIEHFTRDALEVMELLEKDGKRLTPYETPILYRRR